MEKGFEIRNGSLECSSRKILNMMRTLETLIYVSIGLTMAAGLISLTNPLLAIVANIMNILSS